MNKNIKLTKSDIDSLRHETGNHRDNLFFKMNCLAAISIKIHALIKNNIECRDLFYNKVVKLASFCDESFYMEDDVDILLLEDSGVQYSYIKNVIDGIPEMIYVCQIYDDTYASRMYYDEYDKNRTIFKLLKLYNYEYSRDIEAKIKDKIISRIASEVKSDLKYRFIVEKHFSNKLNILNRFTERSIIDNINSILNLNCSSIYLAVAEDMVSRMTFKLEKELKRIFPAYNIQKKSLNRYEEEIYEQLNDLAKSSINDMFTYSFNSEILFLNELYKIAYNVKLNINKYNNIINNINCDIISSLYKNECKTFQIQHYDKEMLCSNIEITQNNVECNTDWCINDLTALCEKKLYLNVTPNGESFKFNEFKIMQIHNSEIIYELSEEVWNDLYEIKMRIFKLLEEQRRLAKSIINNN